MKLQSKYTDNILLTIFLSHQLYIPMLCITVAYSGFQLRRDGNFSDHTYHTSCNKL